MPDPEILCCGEALIDMLERTTARGEDAFVPVCGGSVFNTAIALGRLGARAQFFSGLSRDMFGQRLAAALDDSNVGATLCPRSARPTTLAFVMLNDGQAEYAFYDENTAGRMLTPAHLPALPDRITTLFFGGISLATTPCAEAYEALMQREAGRRVIMLDPNIRPGFASDEPAYRARLARLIALADIVKLSDEDLRWLMGDGPQPGLIEGILAQKPVVLFLTEGAKGATAHCRTGRFHAPARPVTVVDTIGAGDTFNAGVLQALARAGALRRARIGELAKPSDWAAATLREAVLLGTRAAAVTVSRAGANPPFAAEIT